MSNTSNLAFCLEYSNHKTDLIDAFDDYLKNESMVDVMLSCEGNTIKAHKMVLSAGSTYFRNIFSAFKNPFQFPVLIIKDMPFKDLKAIVEFLYRGEVVVPVEQVSSLSKSAQSLFIKGLEKYFNKSAMVNVGNQALNSSSSSNTTINNNAVNNTSQISSNKSKSDPKPSISMSLRKTRRQNYRQLSNGDFDSEEDMSEEEQQSNQMNNSEVIQIRRGQQTQVTYKRKNAVQISKPIKSEVVLNDRDIIDKTDGPPLLEMQFSIGSDSYQIPDNDNESDKNDNNEDNDENEESDYDESYNDTKESQPSTSTFTTSSQALNINYPKNSNSKPKTSEPRGLIRNPVRIAPRRVKTPFMGRHPRRRKMGNKRSSLNSNITTTSSNSRLGPIKADPDKVEIIHCSMCPRVFSQTSSLNIHMKRIHGDDDKEHICELCGKKYSWRSGLYKHMRTHKR